MYILDKKINNFEKNPANGGIPAIENIFIIIKIDNVLFNLNKLDKSVKYFIGFLLKYIEINEVQILILIIIYIKIYNKI